MSKMTRAKRLQAVEVAMREHGYSGSWMTTLAKQAGVSTKTIYRDRDVVVGYLRDEMLGTREDRRTRFLLDLDADLRQAQTDRRWAPVATLRNLQARVTGLDVPPPEPEADQPEAADTDPLLAHLRDVRGLRRDAQSRGSMVAAARLLEQEALALASIRERDAQEAAQRAQVASTDEVLAEAKAAIAAMPTALRDALRAALDDGKI